jgi:hypothetical protein
MLPGKYLSPHRRSKSKNFVPPRISISTIMKSPRIIIIIIVRIPSQMRLTAMKRRLQTGKRKRS